MLSMLDKTHCKTSTLISCPVFLLPSVSNVVENSIGTRLLRHCLLQTNKNDKVTGLFFDLSNIFKP